MLAKVQFPSPLVVSAFLLSCHGLKITNEEVCVVQQGTLHVAVLSSPKTLRSGGGVEGSLRRADHGLARRYDKLTASPVPMACAPSSPIAL